MMENHIIQTIIHFKEFDIDRSAAAKRLNNIFKDGEFDENSVCAKFAQVADLGKHFTCANFAQVADNAI